MKSTGTFMLLAALAVPAVAQQTSPTVALGPNSTLLNITADGRSHRAPDIAMFSAGVVTQATTASQAMTENSRRMDAVVAALRRAGIADRDIQTSTISLQPRYSDPERDVQIRARQTGQPYIPPPQPQAPTIIGY
ncbi:MAG TPA: SIMPL domain-containing protein, partial [Sphingomicrobium sp.]|nr:SIMPL domain-containing protein [Sphingomicrobium sp.]